MAIEIGLEKLFCEKCCNCNEQPIIMLMLTVYFNWLSSISRLTFILQSKLGILMRAKLFGLFCYK